MRSLHPASLALAFGTALGAALAGAAAPVRAQQPVPQPAAPQPAPGASPSSRLTIDRIFKSGDFQSAPLPSVLWLRDGRSYLDMRPAAGGGTDIVRVDVGTGRATVLAAAATLVDERGQPIEVEDIALSADESKALLFHRSVRVWRINTRGVYHVVDFKTKRVTPVATITTPGTGASPEPDSADAPLLGQSPESPSFLARGLASGAVDKDLQMFAKFSPDGRQVAFVRGNNLHVTDLATGQERQLTTDGSDDVINGTTDWVYEEELGLQDAFRWSPDSRRIAYWRFDQSAVPAFPMVDELTAYPRVSVLRYPKAGAPNSKVQVGVVDVTAGVPVPAAAIGGSGGPPATAGATSRATPGATNAAVRTTWLEVGGDTGQYLARMEWVDNDSLTVVRLPRRQNRADVLMLSAQSGRGRTLLTDSDSAAYVDVDDYPIWVNGGRQFLWLSDASGWRQLYLHNRDGSLVNQVTRDGADVLGVVAVDEDRDRVYVQAAAPTPTQRQIVRYPLKGGRAERVTTAPGTHVATVGPGARYLVDSYSTASQPTTMTLYELPKMRRVRVLQGNEAMKANLAALAARAPEFFRIRVGSEQLDAFRIVPVDFDSTKSYPVLMYVYGGPASPTVSDAWGGSRYLWHQLLAQQGYVVVSVDNRGAAWRGRDFRKATQLKLGTLESEDQIGVAQWLAKQKWVDPKRIGIWGWSYGGYLTALTASKGGDLFRAAIAVAPVADWRLYDTIYTERFMWTPQENAEGYKAGAPLNYVDGLRARLLLVHGTGDDNVHPQNSIQLAEKLEAAGRPFYMLLYPNRTHAISGGNAQAHLFDSMTRFVKDNL
jgi:dipeptidyl-peptidase-4